MLRVFNKVPSWAYVTLGYVELLDMSGSGIFWRVYELLLEKSLMDDMDLEMVEEYYLKSEGKSLISSRINKDTAVSVEAQANVRPNW
ncbi:hypothetical protein WUBG_07608 [Wuchereria bancrofti]|uniref:Uncharacterized protein n=1 Tax=Wuchereria bancrofti TaxID=6293 RepID=J9B3C4_WUCBA|nr:hypothetical protein WUBG_07608 [Wuchereria bancrofti]